MASARGIGGENGMASAIVARRHKRKKTASACESGNGIGISSSAGGIEQKIENIANALAWRHGGIGAAAARGIAAYQLTRGNVAARHGICRTQLPARLKIAGAFARRRQRKAARGGAHSSAAAGSGVAQQPASAYRYQRGIAQNCSAASAHRHRARRHQRCARRRDGSNKRWRTGAAKALSSGNINGMAWRRRHRRYRRRHRQSMRREKASMAA